MQSEKTFHAVCQRFRNDLTVAALREAVDHHAPKLRQVAYLPCRVAVKLLERRLRTESRHDVTHDGQGIAPDLITVAKSLAGGLPLAGVVGRAAIMDAPLPGGLGGTYAGNPLACAAALATLDVFAEEPILTGARRIGERIRIALDVMRAENPDRVVDARGLGAMRALEFADAADAQRIVDAARERGLLLLKAGSGNVIRFLPPLVISDADLERGLEILADSIHHTAA